MTGLRPLSLLLAGGLVLAAVASASGPTRVDPHHPAASDGASDGSCSACHTKVPAPGARPEDAALRLDPLAVCSTCHPGLPHQGVDVHLGKMVPPGSPFPGAKGVIACFTCHDVHRGVGAGDVDSKLADELLKAAERTEWAGRTEGVTLPGRGTGHPPMLRRPLEDGGLCRACHGDGP